MTFEIKTFYTVTDGLNVRDLAPRRLIDLIQVDFIIGHPKRIRRDHLGDAR